MESCKFCQLITGNRDGEEVIYENDNFIVLSDKYRRTSVGTICLLIPKKHKANLLELPKGIGQELIELLILISNAQQKAFNCKGVRIWTAVNKEAGQSIMHCHIHILPCNSLIDRLIAAIPGLYDIKRKITHFGRNELEFNENFELSEKIRKAINQSIS